MERGPSPVLPGGLSLVVERGSPLAVVSPAAERWPLGTLASTAVAPGSGVVAHRLSCLVVGSSQPGMEFMSPALTGRFLSTVPPGKSCFALLRFHSYWVISAAK